MALKEDLFMAGAKLCIRFRKEENYLDENSLMMKHLEKLSDLGKSATGKKSLGKVLV